MWSHVPNKGEPIVRYYGYYSNVRAENGFLKTTLGQAGFLCPKFQHFMPFREKWLLDNTAGIC